MNFATKFGICTHVWRWQFGANIPRRGVCPSGFHCSDCGVRDAVQVAMSLLCGGAAGLISSTATFPLDLIRRRMQLEGQAGTRMYKGYADVARSVMANGGLRGFYAGILPEYFKVGFRRACRPFCAAQSGPGTWRRAFCWGREPGGERKFRLIVV